ncbi:5'-methylthioadenosine nucleosidase [Bradyrhizobium lablabi]|uniref:phosphorylase family protein n=1 Tax=Bradyrhizobium lablabi TaxID=722472 RepID=UPI001BA57DA7|nr:5'-methylthioadenosine nucleosidase [Bradyrhizobium lablabi]MBR1122834.1 5'-methylthioadenosine nucleosidase [Bradyrhizobium lablabi]
MNILEKAAGDRPVLVVAALKSELNEERAGDDVEVVFSGVGKINAAIATAESLLRRRRALVVNYGTCGKISKGLHGLVEISRVVQRDMMAMPLAPRGVTPYCEDHILESGRAGAVCGTGDSFVTSDDPWLAANSVDVVDMELFAIASVCKRFGVPWRAFKYVTDAADDAAHEQWNANCAPGADLFWDRLGAALVCDT